MRLDVDPVKRVNETMTLLGVVLALVPVLAACVKGPGGTAGDSRADRPVVATIQQARAAIHQTVRVRGTLRREKLGDAVHTAGGLKVVCVESRFGDEMVDADVLIEGRLELTDRFQATTGPNGEVSQGTERGSWTYMIRDCMLRPGERAADQ